MTTEIIKSSSPRLPAPSGYRAYLDRVAADHEAFVRRRRRERLVRRLAWSLTAFSACVIAWFAYWEYFA